VKHLRADLIQRQLGAGLRTRLRGEQSGGSDYERRRQPSLKCEV
jgi:hypothetical protein